MQIIDHRDEPPGFDGPVFRQALGRPRAVAVFYLCAVVGLGALAAALILQPFAHPDVWSWGMGVVVALVLGSMALTYVLQWRRAAGPGNWLVRFGEDGILINCVSFLDLSVPDEARKAVVLPFSEILSVRFARNTVWAPELAEQPLPYRCDCLELTVPPSAASALRDALARIRQLGLLTRLRESLVSAPAEDTIRLAWRGVDARVAPSVETALRLFPPSVRVVTQVSDGR